MLPGLARPSLMALRERTPSESESIEPTEQPATTGTDAIDKEIDTVQKRLDPEALGLTSESDAFTKEQEERIREIIRDEMVRLALGKSE